jgi:methylated-DNA-[protein]-cysteine S-methyltransferase
MMKDSDVYDLLLKIPARKVSTYGDLAKALGDPSASREIGRFDSVIVFILLVV